MDKLGPMCRSVSDCAIVFDAIRGPDGKDQSVEETPFVWQPEVRWDKLRLGFVASEFDAQRPEVQAVYNKALEHLQSLGARMEPVELPKADFDIRRMIIEVEAASAFDDWSRAGRLDVMTEKDRSRWPDTFQAQYLMWSARQSPVPPPLQNRA